MDDIFPIIILPLFFSVLFLTYAVILIGVDKKSEEGKKLLIPGTLFLYPGFIFGFISVIIFISKYIN